MLKIKGPFVPGYLLILIKESVQVCGKASASPCAEVGPRVAASSRSLSGRALPVPDQGFPHLGAKRTRGTPCSGDGHWPLPRRSPLGRKELEHGTEPETLIDF